MSEEIKKCRCGHYGTLGFAIMIGLVVLGLFVGKGLKAIAFQDQYVTVKGLAERDVMANKVVWPLPYKSVSNDMQELYDGIEKNKNVILSFLKSGGITDDEIIVSAPAVTDRLAQSYVPDNVKLDMKAMNEYFIKYNTWHSYRKRKSHK